jgi:sugar phosphate isomerase/epimerase
LEPSTPYEPIRSGSVKVMADAIRATLPLEPDVYVMHATGALAAEFYRMQLPDLAKAMVLRQFQAHAITSLTALLKETGIDSRRIAIETIEFPFDLTLEIADDLDLSICLDTGHVLVGFSGPVTVDHVLDQSLGRLAEVHLHDGPWQGPERQIGYGLDHKPLGVGDLNVASLLDRLQAMEFDGPIIFELQLHEALQSLDVVRKLRPECLET